jgi:putative inorganic carbon (hco3(-)) transporter
MSSISSPVTAPLIDSKNVKNQEREQYGVAYTVLLLFLFMLVAALQNVFKTIDEIKPVQLLAMIALAAGLITKGLRHEKIVIGGPTHFFILFISVTALSVPRALWPGEAFNTAADTVKMLAIFLLISNVVTSENKLKGLAWALCFGGIFPALGTIKNYINGENLVEGFRGAWIGIYGNPNDLSYILAMLVPLAMALIASTKRALVKLIGIGCISLYTLAIFSTFSRLGFLCLAMITLMMILRTEKRVRTLSLLVILGLFSLPFVPNRYWERVGTIVEFQQDKSASDRLIAWKAGFEMFEHNPIFGVGPGCYILGWPDELKEKYGTPRSAHNTFFQVLGELGLLGLITFGLFMLSSFGVVWRLKRTLLARKQILSREEFKANYSQLLSIITAINIGFWVFFVSSLTGGLLFTWYPYIFSAMAVAAQEIYNNKIHKVNHELAVQHRG